MFKILIPFSLILFSSFLKLLSLLVSATPPKIRSQPLPLAFILQTLPLVFSIILPMIFRSLFLFWPILKLSISQTQYFLFLLFYHSFFYILLSQYFIFLSSFSYLILLFLLFLLNSPSTSLLTLFLFVTLCIFFYP